MNKLLVNVYDGLVDSSNMICDGSCHCDCYSGSDCDFE